MKSNLKITLVRDLKRWKTRFSELDFSSMIDFFFTDKYYGVFILHNVENIKSEHEI